VADPLLALQQASPVAAPLIQLFSFLAILTSFIGFVLGLTDFLADALRLPSRQAPLPYLVTLLPPFMVTLFHPNIFLAALDTAGTAVVSVGVAAWPCGVHCSLFAGGLCGPAMWRL
jgi:tyrosine-specific transport protein